LGGVFYLDWLAVGLEMAVADLQICGFADCWVADLRICEFAHGIIPNFLLLLTFRKFVLFGCKGDSSVWWKILF